MSQSLKDKVAIITGSSMGIGKTLAIQMAEQGAKIVLNGRNGERLAKTQLELEAKGFETLIAQGDVSKVEDCKEMIRKTVHHFGKVDVLVNNAGISMEGPVDELNPAVFRKVMEVNYLGSVYPTQVALPQLKETGGSVIFISSAAGIRGIPNFAVYSSSKMALTALAESLRIELSRTKVHVGIAYVGFTENDPQKTIYNAKGKIIAQPKRDFIKAEPPEKVAQRIIQMIERRTFKRVFTGLGKLNAFMNRFFPSIVHTILQRNYWKRKKEIT